MTNVFVLGLDEQNRATLSALPGAEQYRFHQLMTREELVKDEMEWDSTLAEAQDRLDAFDGRVDAVVGYWDFPVSSLIPVLCARRGLPCASLEAVLKCEHKYWSRLEQSRSIDEHPRFGLVELDDRAPPDGVRYPLWLKPVKAFSSALAFRVHDDEEFRSALEEVRAGIGGIGGAFDAALRHAQVPDDVAEAGGQVCLAEEAVSGHQVTVEGYDDGEEFRIYGIIDSYNYEDSPSFERYQYPSKVPREIVDRLHDVSRRVIRQIGLRSVFNIEYFWDPDSGNVALLEINPRHSQSHARMFEQVDGVPNHKCMVDMGLGRTPDFPHRQGEHAVAAKWFYRVFEDARVVRAPTGEELAEVERRIPGVSVEIEAPQGIRLSEMREQDSYSYGLAVVHVGASDEQELHRKYAECLRALPFEFGPA
jgi:hypothetical protein